MARRRSRTPALKRAGMTCCRRRSGTVHDWAEGNLHLRVVEIVFMQHNHLLESLLANSRLDLLEDLVLPLYDDRSYGPGPRLIVGQTRFQ